MKYTAAGLLMLGTSGISGAAMAAGVSTTDEMVPDAMDETITEPTASAAPTSAKTAVTIDRHVGGPSIQAPLAVTPAEPRGPRRPGEP